MTIATRATPMAQTASTVQLRPETVHAFDKYVREAETQMQQDLHRKVPFLCPDLARKRESEIRKGDIVAQFCSSRGPIKVPSGLVHDWIGAIFIPGVTVAQTLSLIQDYDNHKKIYNPEVIDSALKSRHGNHFKIYLRLLKKKVVTVVLDTDHDVEYLPLEGANWFCRSHTTRISEVEGVGSPTERILPPDTGHGFLWRLNSYWVFQQKKGGVYAECRAISLTRDIPFGLAWIIEPIVEKLPRESLVNTLEATRRALQS